MAQLIDLDGLNKAYGINKARIDSVSSDVAGIKSGSITVKNAESAETALAAQVAAKLSNESVIGSTTQPVYFTANGVPSACTAYADATVKIATYVEQTLDYGVGQTIAVSSYKRTDEGVTPVIMDTASVYVSNPEGESSSLIIDTDSFEDDCIPIYVDQRKNLSRVNRVKILDEDGNTSFPNTVSANEVSTTRVESSSSDGRLTLYTSGDTKANNLYHSYASGTGTVSGAILDLLNYKNIIDGYYVKAIDDDGEIAEYTSHLWTTSSKNGVPWQKTNGSGTKGETEYLSFDSNNAGKCIKVNSDGSGLEWGDAGSSGDYLPLTGGTLTGSVTFNRDGTSTMYLYKDGTILTTNKIVVNNENIFKVDNEGTVTAVKFNATSARALKENITPYTDSALDIINSTEIVNFNFKNDESKEHKVGFIADDTDEVLATKDHDKMDLYNCIGVLMKAVQELGEEVKELKGDR